MKFAPLSVAALSALGGWRSSVVEKIVEIHNHTTTIVSTITATETVSVDVPATHLTAFVPTSTITTSFSSPTADFSDEHTSPPNPIHTSPSSNLHSASNINSNSSNYPEPTTTWEDRLDAYTSLAVAFLDSLLDWYLSLATTLWVIVASPIVWLLDNGNGGNFMASAASPSPPVNANFHLPQSIWLASLEQISTEPRFSLVDIVISLACVVFAVSTLHFSSLIIPIYPSRMARDWIAALKRGNGLCWTLAILIIHSTSFGSNGSLEAAFQITGGQLRRMYNRSPCRAAEYLLMWAAWCEGRHGADDMTISRTIRYYVDPLAADAGRAIFQWADAKRQKAMEFPWLVVLKAVGYAFTAGPMQKTREIFWDDFGCHIWQYLRRRIRIAMLKLYPIEHVNRIQAWWIRKFVQDSPSERHIYIETVNMTFSKKMELVETDIKRKAEIEYIENQVLTELAQRCKAYRNTIKALIYTCNYQRQILDIMSACNYTVRHNQPRSDHKGLIVSHKFRFLEEETADGLLVGLTDERKRFMDIWQYAGRESANMKRLTCMDQYIRNNLRLSKDRRPLLFVDEKEIEADRMNPWHFQFLCPGVNFPKWEPYEVQDAEMSPFEEACLAGKGIEAGKKLGKIPDWVSA